MEFPFEFILVLGLAFMCKLAEVLNIDPEVY